MDLCNPSVIKNIMAEANICFRKEFGQNFLVKAEVPQQIAEQCADTTERMILEIGPGIGCLTKELALRYRKVVAVEIDRGLLPVLEKTLSEFSNVTVRNADIMEMDLLALIREESEGLPVSVAANLPYYITTPILMRLLESGIPFETITVMVQKEVAARLTAKPGSADYGAITAVLGFYGEARRLFTVPAGCFLPAPKVDSAVLRLDLFPTPKYKPVSPQIFFRTVKGAFLQRRKTLQNALSAAFPLAKDLLANLITSMGFSPTVRGEQLSTADFVRLSDGIAALLPGAK